MVLIFIVTTNNISLILIIINDFDWNNGWKIMITHFVISIHHPWPSWNQEMVRPNTIVYIVSWFVDLRLNTSVTTYSIHILLLTDFNVYNDQNIHNLLYNRHINTHTKIQMMGISEIKSLCKVREIVPKKKKNSLKSLEIFENFV